jgi:putative transposase
MKKLVKVKFLSFPEIRLPLQARKGIYPSGEVKIIQVKKTFKFRIFPNKKQVDLINKTIDCSRFVYNFFHGKQKEKDAYWYIVEEMKQKGQLPTNEWKGSFFNKYETVKAVRQGSPNQYLFDRIEFLEIPPTLSLLSGGISK